MDFDELYQEIILDHYKHPRHKCDLSHIPEEHRHENPICGDSLKLEVLVNSHGIDRVCFDGDGCAISIASASMMSELLNGKSLSEAKEFVEAFIKVMQGESSAEILTDWGDLASLSGVTQFPLRVKCATLAWHALKEQVHEKSS